MTLALLLNNKSPDKKEEDEDRRPKKKKKKKEEQERSQEKSTEQKPTKEAQEKTQHNNQITVSDEKFISRKENAHSQPTKVQDKAAHFYKASSPSQGLDCTLSWPRWPHSLWKIQHTGQKHYLAAHPPGIEEIRRLTFRYSGQKESTYQDSLASVAHSDPQAQILKFLSRCWKINYRPHSTLSAQAQIPKFQGQIQGIFKCHSHIPGQPALLSTFLYLHVPLTLPSPSIQISEVNCFLPALRCTFRSAGPNSKISLPVLKINSPTSFLLFSSPGHRKSAKDKETLKIKSEI